MKPTPKPENPLLSLAVNILLPVLVLNKGSHYLSAQLALGVALCFPLIYGIQDYYRRRHKNYVSIMGLVNILLTGGLASLNLTGIWFAFKEASLPLALGILVLGSAFTSNPAARMFFCNPHLLKMDLIEERLKVGQHEFAFSRLLRQTTLWLSVSFFISAAANFALAFFIFKEIDQALPLEEQHTVLNNQLAHMTWMGFAVIALPLMIFSAVLIYDFLRRVSKLVDVPIDGLMHS
jgi:hypothetical protein